MDFPKRGPYLFKGSYTFIISLLYIIYIYSFQYTYYLCKYIHIHTHIGRSRFFPFFWFFQSKSFEFDPRSKSALCQLLAWCLLNEDVLSAVPTTMDHYQVGRWRSLCQVHVFRGLSGKDIPNTLVKNKTQDINTQRFHAGICLFAFTLLNKAIFNLRELVVAGSFARCPSSCGSRIDHRLPNVSKVLSPLAAQRFPMTYPRDLYYYLYIYSMYIYIYIIYLHSTKEQHHS